MSTLTVRQRLNMGRHRARSWLAENHGGRLHFAGDMTRREQARWASAATWAGLGELTVAWLHGEMEQNPVHCAPPCEETLPLIPALAAANRAGFVTTGSQRADHGPHPYLGPGASWEAWVTGLIPDSLYPALARTVTGTRLKMYTCRYRRHCKHPHGWGCWWEYDTEMFTERCPRLAREIRSACGVLIEDPKPDRNDVLWPALERFATGRQS